MLAGCALLAGCRTQATRDIVFTAPWQDYERIVVRTTSGRIELTATPGAELRVTGQMRIRGATESRAIRHLDALEVVARPDETSPRTLLVEIRVPDALASYQVGASLAVNIPVPCAADARTSDGAIVATRLAGPLVLATTNGGIEVRDVAGEVRAETSSGSITMRAIGGDVSATTSNGGVTLAGIRGDCQVVTRNGPVWIEGATGNLRVETSNAPIDVSATPPDEGSVVLTTSNGPIELTLPPTMRGRVVLAAPAGLVAVDGPGVEFRRQARERIEGVLGGGGAGIITAESTGSVVRLHLR